MEGFLIGLLTACFVGGGIFVFFKFNQKKPKVNPVVERSKRRDPVRLEQIKKAEEAMAKATEVIKENREALIKASSENSDEVQQIVKTIEDNKKVLEDAKSILGI